MQREITDIYFIDDLVTGIMWRQNTHSYKKHIIYSFLITSLLAGTFFPHLH